MTAAYSQPRLTPEGRAAFEIRNQSRDAWRADEGFAVGYHLFDADTGALIVDGARVPLDLQPGESARVELPIEIPEEDGRYQVLISPMRENVCWFYEQGWPFLVVERGRIRTATQSVLRRERLLRALGRAFVYPLRSIWRNRGLIRTMVRRDILGRYRGSFAGAFWTIINPLLLMLTYFFVFGVVLNRGESRTGFALYFLAGMLPWLAFSEAAGRSPSVILEHRNFVKKLVFAVETLPLNLVTAGLVSELFAILLFCVFLFAVRGGIPPAVVWLPVLLVPQLLFTAGMSWFLAALGVFVRDLSQVIGFLLTLWFFLTPICYPEASLPAPALAVLSRNPIYTLVKGYRAIFLENHAPSFGSLWKLWLLGAIVFILGHAWFYKLRKSFADLI